MPLLVDCIADSWGNELIRDNNETCESVKAVITYHVVQGDMDKFIESFSE